MKKLILSIAAFALIAISNQIIAQTEEKREIRKEVNMEDESSAGKMLRPDRVRFSPGVAKVWVKWEQTGAHSILASYNMTSVTDGGAA